MKKKFLSALFIITLSISLTACGGNNNESTTTKLEENTAQEESKENFRQEFLELVRKGNHTGFEEEELIALVQRGYKEEQR